MNRTGDTATDVPQPKRGDRGGTDPGPRNAERDRQNPDLLAAPDTDSGTVPNLAVFVLGRAQSA